MTESVRPRPLMHQQNWIAKRKSTAPKDIMNVMLISSCLPVNMWREAILSACHLHNKVSHDKLDKTSYEIWKKHARNLHYLKMWGCLAKVGISDTQMSKIGPKYVGSVSVGHAQNSSA